ncbi:unnamed protein product [Paramecium primaurelia]|uniref:Uncharacterized protein n=1 Tax=Paramecium primaurelia TaxID=5886 RepID=A0A8S1PPE4_PARPR|nr:unnamed protein product [Paramecium primaurelia]
MNLTQLESIFSSLNSLKQFPYNVILTKYTIFVIIINLNGIKKFQESSNINNVLGVKQKRHHNKVQKKVSILEAQGLQNDNLKEVCLTNQFFYRNFSDKNIHYQIIKLKI